MAEMNASPEVKLLLLGKTGAGKSATGNLLLGRKAFTVSGTALSVTTRIRSEFSDIDGHRLKVVDGPGVQDTGLKDDECTATLAINLAKALHECNGAIDAVVLVFKYGDRLTPETEAGIGKILKITGDLTSSGILVMTNAYNWNEEFSDIDFLTWCREHDPSYQGLFKKCGYRCLLFENLRQDEAGKKRQREELLKLLSKTQPYTNQHFQIAETERNKYIANTKCHVLKEDYQRKISLLIGEMNSVSRDLSISDKSRKYEDIVQRADDLLQQAQKDDAGSGAMAGLQEQLRQTITAVRNNNDQALRAAASKLQALKDDRKGKVAWAVVTGIATVLSVGIATPTFKKALKELAEHDEEINKNTLQQN